MAFLGAERAAGAGIGRGGGAPDYLRGLGEPLARPFLTGTLEPATALPCVGGRQVGISPVLGSGGQNRRAILGGFDRT